MAPRLAVIVVSFNVRHCGGLAGEGRRLDIGYLGRLGPESIPALRHFADHCGDPERSSQAREMVHRLEQALEARMTDWRAWTWQRHRLMAPESRAQE